MYVAYRYYKKKKKAQRRAEIDAQAAETDQTNGADPQVVNDETAEVQPVTAGGDTVNSEPKKKDKKALTPEEKAEKARMRKYRWKVIFVSCHSWLVSKVEAASAALEIIP